MSKPSRKPRGLYSQTMSQNPYESPAAIPTPDKPADRPPSLVPVTKMFARHAIFLAVMGIVLAIGRWLLTNYLTTAGIRVHAPTLLVLKLARDIVAHWPSALLFAPIYFVWLALLDALDRRTSGVRNAWSFIFWTLSALLLAALAFGFVLPFL